jgi:uncharacterized damage-inducible protein DinB
LSASFGTCSFWSDLQTPWGLQNGGAEMFKQCNEWPGYGCRMEQRFPRQVNDERTMICEFLDEQRTIFESKVSGLSIEQLGRTVASSTMTLAGLVKHLAFVEDSWFQDDFLGLGDPEPWASAPFAEDHDWEWHSAVNDEPTYLLGLYRVACERSRAAVRSADSLDALAVKVDRRTGAPISLRWILLHMIEETARHNGHADLLREAIDGATG